MYCQCVKQGAVQKQQVKNNSSNELRWARVFWIIRDIEPLQGSSSVTLQIIS